MFYAFEEIQFLLVFFVCLQHLLCLFDPAVEDFQVREDQLEIDGFDIALRVNASFHVDNVVVDKTADHMDDGVAFADIGEEFIAQPFAFRRAAHKAGNIDEFDRGGCVFLRVVQVGKPVEAFIRHGDHPDVRLNGAERIIRRLRAGVGNGIEKSAFPHVREPHNSKFHQKTFFAFFIAFRQSVLWLCPAGRLSVWSNPIY